MSAAEMKNITAGGIGDRWDCTHECYDWAKSACDTDSECAMLCDLLFGGLYCNAGIAIACAYNCAKGDN